jgi:hypothetical protein
MKLSPAARVAAVATAVIAVVYIIGVVVVNLVVSAHLTDQNDDSLHARLVAARHDPAVLSERVTRLGTSPAVDVDADAAPIFVWAFGAGGSITAHSPGAPVLPASLLAAHAPRDGLAFAGNLAANGPFRLKLARAGSGWLIAGQSASWWTTRAATLARTGRSGSAFRFKAAGSASPWRTAVFRRGIRPEDRPRLFDRFHRATSSGPGAGLGLAIGDSIVRSTGGRWQVGDSSLGGALMAVSWRHCQPHRSAAPRVTVSNA